MIMNDKMIKVGLAASPDVDDKRDKVFMLFIKDDDIIPDKRDATKYDVEKDTPLFALAIINFLTLVGALVLSNLIY